MPCSARTSSVHTHPPVETSVDVVRHVHACYDTQLPLTRTVRVHALATAGPGSDSRDRHGVRCPLSTLAEEVTGTARTLAVEMESGLPPDGAAVRCLPAPVGRRRPRVRSARALHARPRRCRCPRPIRTARSMMLSVLIISDPRACVLAYAHTATCQDAELTDGACTCCAVRCHTYCTAAACRCRARINPLSASWWLDEAAKLIKHLLLISIR